MRHFWLALPLALVIALDAAFTLLGQPRAYWAGDHAVVNEGSPIGVQALGLGPRAFACLMAAWILGALILAKSLPGMLGQLAYAGIALGHAWGSATWIPRMIRVLAESAPQGDLGEALRDLAKAPSAGYWGTLLHLLILSLTAVFCWRRAGLLPSQAPKAAPKKP